MWTVRYLPEAEVEQGELPPVEQVALRNAVLKLENAGPGLGSPHSSKVQGAEKLRELRPRTGRSPWRALYRQYGNTFVIAAVCAEAQADPRKFNRGVTAAERRLEKLEED